MSERRNMFSGFMVYGLWMNGRMEDCAARFVATDQSSDKMHLLSNHHIVAPMNQPVLAEWWEP